MIRLIIFDVDGTLARKYSLELLPNVKKFFRLVLHGNCPSRPKLAVATNQGGVGMRYWMETEGFGQPQNYPTVESFEERMRGLIDALGSQNELRVYTSYRYKNKQGIWTPVPAGEENNPRWSKLWRKPEPGMLLQAMVDAGVSAEETLYVGDRAEDQEAAQAAGCAFAWAERFFSRDWESCDQLLQLDFQTPG